MRKLYTIYATNLYVVASVLVNNRIPFSFRPHKMYKVNGFRSPFGRSTIDIELDTKYMTIADILYFLNEKYGGTFDFEIISEIDL